MRYMEQGTSGVYLPLTGGTLTGALTAPGMTVSGANNLVMTGGDIADTSGATTNRITLAAGADQIAFKDVPNSKAIILDFSTTSQWWLRNAAGNGDAALKAGSGTFSGLVTTPASATGGAGLNVPHGAAPTSPVNGDVWTTTAGLFVRINGATKTVTLT